MNTLELQEVKLVGLSLGTTTTNKEGKSAIDCGDLWQKFERGNYAEKIQNKISDNIFAVYHQYEGDFTQPYSYFIGCNVKTDANIPEGMDTLILHKGTYQKIIARGIIPDCVANAWREIWNSAIPRAYQTDFEVYDGRSKDWNNAEVDIFLSV